MYSNKKIVIVGSSNTDMSVRADHLPKPGETIIGGKFLMNHGGKGANQAVAVARLGGEAVFVCKVGDDMFGNNTLEMLQKEGINTSYLSKSKDAPSGIALISVDLKGENSIVVASGANACLSEEDVQDAESEIKAASIVLMQMETPLPTLICAAEIAKKHGTTVVLNPAPAPKEPIPDALLKNVDILIPNATEAQMISGIEITDDASAKKSIAAIMSRGVKTVIVTIGSKGAVTLQDGELVKVPAFSVQSVDATAAGDTFCGALCVSLCKNNSLKDAILYANKASSISVTRMGAQASIPYEKEVNV